MVTCCACAAPVKDLFPPGDNASTKPIYLVSHGWHAGIVLRRADIPANLWPENYLSCFKFAIFLPTNFSEEPNLKTLLVG